MKKETQIFAVTGNPVMHSKSPAMFNNVFEKKRIDAAYIRLAAEDPVDAIFVIKSLGIRGVNVTAPFKESIVKYIDKVHDDAKALGCVNTIINKKGKLHGYNTDPYGVTQSFADNGIILKGKQCLVIGAGGAGKAAAFGLLKEGAIVTIVNRTNSTAKKFAKRIGCNSNNFDKLEELVKNTDIIISALSQNINPVKKKWLRSSHIIFDANYKNSLLNPIALETGCTVLNAENWLLNQAVRSFEIFLNEIPDVNLMKEGLKCEDLSYRKRKISLIGLTGSGKTSVGKVLSKNLNFDFIDIDKSVSEKKGMIISEIFENYGEAYFRELEMKELAESFSSDNPLIISCGGGIVKCESNRIKLKENSIVVWIFVSPETIYSRADLNDRPLLQVEDPLRKLKNLLKERKGMYSESAHIIFCNEQINKRNISKKIIKELKTL